MEIASPSSIRARSLEEVWKDLPQARRMTRWQAFRRIAHHAFAVAQRQQVALSALVISLVMCSFLLCLLCTLIFVLPQSLPRALGPQTMQAFLRSNVDEAREKDLLKRIQAVAGVSSVTSISSDDSLQHLDQELGLGSALVEELARENPLPRSIRIGVSESGVLADLAAKLKHEPEIEYLDAGEGIELLRSIQRVTTKIGLFVGLLALVGLTLISAVYARLLLVMYREEREILMTLGAFRWQVFAPIALQACGYGLVASALGAGLAAIMLIPLGDILQRVLSIQVQYPFWTLLLGVFLSAFGTFVGVLLSWVGEHRGI